MSSQCYKNVFGEDSLGGASSGGEPIIPDKLDLPDGNANEPTYSFASNNDTGMYLDENGQLSLSSDGNKLVTLDKINDNLEVNGGIVCPSLWAESAYFYNRIFWPNPLLSDDLRLEQSGNITASWTIANGFDSLHGVRTPANIRGSANTSRLLNGAGKLNVIGSAASPAIAFNSNGNATNNGIFMSAADTLGITTGGTSRMTIGDSVITSTVPIQTPSGSLSSPAIQIGDIGTGLSRPSTNTMEIITNNIMRIRVSPTNTLFNVPVYLSTGTVTQPSLTFNTDTGNNTGFYLAGNDDMRVTVGGVERCRFNTTGFVVNGATSTTSIQVGANGTSAQSIIHGSVDLTNLNIANNTSAIIHTITVPAGTFPGVPRVALTYTAGVSQVWLNFLILNVDLTSTATSIVIRGANPLNGNNQVMTGDLTRRWILVG